MCICICLWHITYNISYLTYIYNYMMNSMYITYVMYTTHAHTHTLGLVDTRSRLYRKGQVAQARNHKSKAELSISNSGASEDALVRGARWGAFAGGAPRPHRLPRPGWHWNQSLSTRLSCQSLNGCALGASCVWSSIGCSAGARRVCIVGNRGLEVEVQAVVRFPFTHLCSQPFGCS